MILGSKKDILKKFYSSVFDFKIEEMQHRQFRFDVGSHFIKCPKHITNSHQLSKELFRISPLNAYYSVSKWLNPLEVVPKTKAKKISQNIYLGSDLVFDIDYKPFSEYNIELARNMALKLLDYLENKKIKIKYIAFSGGKGFHIVCIDENKYSDPNPFYREKMATDFRLDILKSIEDEKIIVDERVTSDTRRILRIPGTINSNTGYMCRIIEREELKSSAKQILKNTKCINLITLQTLWDDFVLRTFAVYRGITRRRVSATHNFSSFVSNTIIGPKNRAVAIFHYKNEDLKKIEDFLKKLQIQYQLSDFYIFSDGYEINVLCLDSIELPQLIKIMKAAKSNWQQQINYKQSWMRIEGKFDIYGKCVADKPHLIKIIPNESKRIKSTSHILMLKKEFGLNIISSQSHGNEEYKVIDTIIDD